MMIRINSTWLIAFVVFLMFWAILARGAQVKGDWDYHCYQTADAMVNFINTLTIRQSDTVKVMTPLTTFCVIYRK